MNDDKRPYPNDPGLNELLGLGSGDNGSYPHQGAFGGYDETGESPAPDYTDASSYSDSAEPLEEGDVLNSFSEREAYEQRKNPVAEAREQNSRTRTQEEISREKAQVKAEKKRRKKKSKKNGCLFKMVWLVMIVLVSVVLAQYIMIGANDLLAVNRTEGTAEVSIPADADIDTVADILEEAGVINSAQFFKLYMKITKPDTTFTKGDYTDMQTNLDYEAIVTYLQTQSNRTDVVTVTFLEGMNLEDFGDTLEESGVCGKEEFLEKCNSTEFDEDYTFLSQITNSDERYYRLEGYLFPDTYDFYQDSDPETVIRKCLYNFELKIMEPTIEQEDDTEISVADLAQQNGFTVDQLVTLASMVQAEGANEDDMRVIAHIFRNRLDPNMNEGVSQLGSDPTVYYPYSSREEAPEGFESRYNTYEIVGLPPGAIDNPGMMAINAVLNPDTTDNYLYFCHSADGTPYYAYTAEGHYENQVKAGLIDPNAEG